MAQRLKNALRHFEASCSQSPQSPTRDTRVWISTADNDPTETGPNNGLCAGTRSTLKTTGFQGHRQTGSPQCSGAIASLCLGQRLHLCMIPAGRLRTSAAENAPRAKNDGPHRRVRMDTPRAPGGPRQSPLHVNFVVSSPAHPGPSSGLRERAGSSDGPASGSVASRRAMKAAKSIKFSNLR